MEKHSVKDESFSADALQGTSFSYQDTDVHRNVSVWLKAAELRSKKNLKKAEQRKRVEDNAVTWKRHLEELRQIREEISKHHEAKRTMSWGNAEGKNFGEPEKRRLRSFGATSLPQKRIQKLCLSSWLTGYSFVAVSSLCSFIGFDEKCEANSSELVPHSLPHYCIKEESDDELLKIALESSTDSESRLEKDGALADDELSDETLLALVTSSPETISRAEG
ncbi:unnamed protein product [Gongylonema pulchrum]|uniref:Remorin_C domain-containing protein n=1 Tax=Gongylonema pulchrum TaxID=637853 RepID=A0A183DR33_9BILA|nr:unnamed protein product [Gongylonema pulchrum]